MSKRNKKIDLVEEKRRELGVKLERLFELAADWIEQVTGRRPKQGIIREALVLYRRRRKIASWVKRFVLNAQRPLHA